MSSCCVLIFSSCGAAFHLCVHEHIATGGVGSIGTLLALPCQFVHM